METIAQSYYLCSSSLLLHNNTTKQRQSPKTCQESVEQKFMSSRLKLDHKSSIGCVAMERGLQSEVVINELEEEAEELMQLGGDHKCKQEKSGIVELLECLEKEPIMGDDQGREATDYNRRARIFDKSSRVFQALKNEETNNQSS